MATNYPSSLDSFAANADNVDTAVAADVNNLQDAMLAAETKLAANGNAILNTGGLDSSADTPSANHLVLTPGTNKLVKIAVLRQDITSNTYANNSVILTGWTYVQGDTNTYRSKAITFGITFAAAPVVLVSACYKTHNTPPATIADLDSPDQRPTAIVGKMTTTGFNFIMCFNYAAPTTQYHGGTWIAIGVLS